MEPRVSGVWEYLVPLFCGLCPQGCTQGFFVTTSILEVSLDGPHYLRQIRVLVTNPGLRKLSPFGSRLGNTNPRAFIVFLRKGEEGS